MRNEIIHSVADQKRAKRTAHAILVVVTLLTIELANLLGAQSTSESRLVAGKQKVNSKDGLTYVWLPPGTFQMGCSPGTNECSDSETPAHSLTITPAYY